MLLPNFRKFYKQAGNIHLAYYLLAADKLGIDYEVLAPSYAKFEANGKRWYIVMAMTPLNSMTAKLVAGNKHLTNKVLKEDGISVPKQKLVNSFEELLDAKKELGKIVVKPKRGSGGRGITILPETEDELKQAYEAATKKYPALVEEYFEGTNYRVIVLDSKVLAVIKRIEAAVIGDGQSTILELIEKENEKKKQVLEPLIRINTDLITILKRQGYTLNSVIPKNKVVKVHGTANLSEGGTIANAENEVAKEFLDVCVKAAKSVGLKFAGVDLMVKDPADFNSGYIINEVNHSPGARLAYLGTGKNIAEEVLKYIVEKWEG